MGLAELSLRTPARASLSDRRDAGGFVPVANSTEAIEAREVIELAIVRLAALRRTEEDLERLRTSLAGMSESHEDPDVFSEFDLALHVALADAARNRLLAGTFSSLREPVCEMIRSFSRTAARENRTDALVESHVQLVDAVERRDADGAARIISEMMAILRIEAGRPQGPVD